MSKKKATKKTTPKPTAPPKPIPEQPPLQPWVMGFIPEAAGWIPPEDRTTESQKIHEQYVFDTPTVSEAFGSPGYNADRPRMWQLMATAIEKKYVPKEYVRNNTLKNIAQIIGSCFPAGTLVRMADGSEKPIEEIAVGDEVISHTGESRRVLRTFRREYTGDFVEFRASGYPFSVTATADHRFATPVSRGVKFSVQRTDCEKFEWTQADDFSDQTRVLVGNVAIPQIDPAIVIDLKEVLGERAVEIDAIRRGDSRKWSPSRSRRASERLNDEEKRFGIDLSGRITLKGCKYRKAVYRYIPWTASLARLMGLYVAEGHLEQWNVMFTFSASEENLAAEVLSLVEGIFGVKGYIDRHENNKNKSSLTVVFCNKTLVEVFRHFVPGDCYSKRAPKYVFQSGVSSRLAFIRGWIDGDGHGIRNRITEREYRGIGGTTASEGLAKDVASLAGGCGLIVSVSRKKPGKISRALAYRVGFYGESATALEVHESTLTVQLRPTAKRHKFGTARRVCEYNRFAVESVSVYCLEVEEDHSFLANGIVAKNCVGFGAGNMLLWASVIDAIIRKQTDRILVPFIPYHYGRGRLHSGIRGPGSGSFGSGQAKALQIDGYLARDMQGLPAPNFGDSIYWTQAIEYSWSDGARIQDKWIQEGKKHLVPTVARLTSTDEAARLADSFYTFTIASAWGGNMQCRVQDGVLLNKHVTRWMHQMWVLDYIEHPRLGRLWWVGNQWRYPHGKDPGGPWDGNTGAPEGGFYITDKDLAWIISKQDSFAFADPQGFIDRSREFSWLMG